MTPKQLVLEAVRRLPEQASFEEIANTVAFLAAIREGEEDIKRGRVLSNEPMKQRLGLWLQQHS